MRISSALLMLLTVAPLAACQSAKTADEGAKQIGLAEALPIIPLPPDGEVLTSAVTSEAMQFVAVSPRSADSVVAYYRDFLSKPPWILINETVTPDSVTSFYVEQDGPSLWITVQRNGETGAMVVIAGATADTAAVGKAKAEAANRKPELIPAGGKKPN